MKSQNITPAFIKSFEDVGYKNIPAENLVSLKALDVATSVYKIF